MEEQDRKTELLVGLFLFVGLVMLSLLVLQFGSIREHFKRTYTLSVPLADASGIREGSPVMLGGARIGKVARTPDLNPKFTGVIVTLDIYDDKKIPADAKIGVGTAGLLGDSLIEIKTSGKVTDEFIPPGTVIGPANLSGPSGISALSETAQDLSKKVDVALEDLRGAVKDLRVGLKRINEGALSDDSMKDLKGTISHLNKVVTRLDEKTFGEETSNNVKAAVASFKDAAKSFDDQVQKLGPMFDKLNPAFEKVDKVVTDADKVMASADKAMKSLDKGVVEVSEVAKDLRTGPGLLPALLGDSELKDEFSMLISNLRRRGILFYKDKAGEERAKNPPPSQTEHGGNSGRH